MLTVVHVKTHNVIRFADPYKRCTACGAWVDGVLDTDGPMIVVPCEHQAHYRDVCASWGPVDGCTCPPEWHEPRTPEPGDARRF